MSKFFGEHLLRREHFGHENRSAAKELHPSVPLVAGLTSTCPQDAVFGPSACGIGGIA